MHNLTDLLSKIDYELVTGSLNVNITELIDNTDKLREDCLFVCIKGYTVDSHDFIDQVIEGGARAIVVEKDLSAILLNKAVAKSVTVIKVSDTKYALALIACQYEGNPADKLRIIGITGTKGKTTTTYMVKSILEHAGYKVGLIGTIEVIIGNKHLGVVNTTPDAMTLQKYFKMMLDEGISVVVMEVASQGLKLKRTQGFMFEIGVFTNLERDHIGPNEHESIEEYIECKSLLFRQCSLGIVNADDPYVLKVINKHSCNIETYGFNENADICASNLTLLKGNGSLSVEFDVSGDIDMHVLVPTPGRFSVYNALCAIAICMHFGVNKEDILKALLAVKVKGRIEVVDTPLPFTIIIDYAHNALSLESLLATLKEYKPGRLICLFGCGGNRSKERRFGMGEVSGKYADLTIITSDNPRDEDPKAIMNDIKEGVLRTSGKYAEEINRKAAIRYALNFARKGDIVVLAGKGHEDYQLVKGVKYPMDERVIIKEILEEK